MPPRGNKPRVLSGVHLGDVRRALQLHLSMPSKCSSLPRTIDAFRPTSTVKRVYGCLGCPPMVHSWSVYSASHDMVAGAHTPAHSLYMNEDGFVHRALGPGPNPRPCGLPAGNETGFSCVYRKRGKYPSAGAAPSAGLSAGQLGAWHRCMPWYLRDSSRSGPGSRTAQGKGRGQGGGGGARGAKGSAPWHTSVQPAPRRLLR